MMRQWPARLRERTGRNVLSRCVPSGISALAGAVQSGRQDLASLVPDALLSCRLTRRRC